MMKDMEDRITGHYVLWHWKEWVDEGPYLEIIEAESRRAAEDQVLRKYPNAFIRGVVGPRDVQRLA